MLNCSMRFHLLQADANIHLEFSGQVFESKPIVEKL